MSISQRLKHNLLLTTALLPAALLLGAVITPGSQGYQAAGSDAQDTTDARDVAAADDEVEQTDQDADESEGEDNVIAQDRIVVTGSRIRRAAVTNISPTITVDSEEFEARGAINVLDLLEEIPALTGSESIDDNQFSFGDSGVRRANLRGLGAYRSLTVVDNRRRAATASSFFGRNSFDWNVLPQNLISRVDVLTGGASSIYGSDAVSGVINIILEDEVDGFEAGGGGYRFESGKYDSYFTYISGGRVEDRWSVIGSFEYSENSELTRYEAGREGLRSWVPNAQPRLSWPHIDRVEQVIDPDAEYDTIPKFNVLDIWAGAYANAIPSFDTPWPFRGYHAIDGDGNLVLDENGDPDLPRWVFGERVPGEGEDFFIDGVANPLVYDPGLGKFRAISLGAGGLLNFWGCDARAGCEMVEQAYDNTYWSPSSRYNGYLSGKYLTDRIELGVEFIYAHTEARSDIGPIFLRRGDRIRAYNRLEVADLSTPSAGNGDLPTITGMDRNPLFTEALHDQLDALGVTNFQIASRNLWELGARRSTREQDYYALALTFDGELPNGWIWDASYDYGYAQYRTTTSGQARGAAFANVLDVVIDGATGNAVCRSAAARAAGCTPIDLLNGLTPQVVDYLQAGDAIFDFTSAMHQVMGALSGDSYIWFELPAGPIEFATGLEWRYEDNSRNVDPITQAGEGFYGSQLPSFSVDNSVTEGFVEVIAPLLKNRPGVKVLDFEGAYRLSQYEKGGSDILDTYKFGLRWALAPDLTFRAVQARSIRSPHPAELGLPGSIGFIGYTDPCSNAVLPSNPDRRAGCLTWTGFSDEELDRFTGLNTGQDESGGNPDLRPEISDTLTVGIVFQPRFLNRFWMTVDYFDIEFSDLIAQLGEQRILNECAERYSPDGQFCQLVDRDPTTRQIQLVRDTFVNVNGSDIDGWDMQMGYSFGVADVVKRLSLSASEERDMGALSLSFGGQYLEKDEFIDIDGIASDRAGAFWNPDVRLRGGVGYSYKDFRFYWSVNYIGATNTDASEPRWETDDITYHDASATYYLERGSENYARLTVGVSNIFDEGTRPHTWTYGGSQFDRISGRGFYGNFSVPFGR